MRHSKKIIYLAGFLLSLHLAMVSYVNSSFLASFLSEKRVGILYVLGSIASVLALLFVPKILRKIGGYRFLLYVVFFNAFTLLCLSLVKSVFVLAPIFIFYIVLNSLIVFSLDELLEIFSKNSDTGKTRGIYLTVLNLGWILTQAFSYLILADASFSTRYLIAFSVMIGVFLISLFGMKNIPDPNYDRVPPLESIPKFFKNKNLARSYQLNFLIQFFYSWMVIYTPIYLFAHLGFSWGEISFIFMIMLIPFVLIQFPLGKYADRVGERKIMMLGFLLAAMATISLFFITRHEVWIWAIFLFITRIGAAIIEIMSDVYFFKHIEKENDEFISIYRNTSSVAYVLAPLLASFLFFLLPSFKFIFPILGALMFYGVYLSSTIKKSDI